ncbi:MAG: hypothetical protein K8F62_07140 [Pseudorhodoplanes sp.]|nr:hypothetical protein [Pseudorhodoplanes sp.]
MSPEMLRSTTILRAERHLPLAPVLWRWVGALFALLEEQGIPWLVLRKGEELPNTIGFDVDVLVDSNAIDGLTTEAHRMAAGLGLVFQMRRKAGGARLAAFLVEPNSVTRKWVLIDLQSRVSAPGYADLDVHAIATRTIAAAGMNVRVPNADWAKALSERHAARKRDLATLASIARPKKLRVRLGRILFFRLPFIHRHRPLFFAVCGPDGVGKSTTIALMLDMLRGYPLDVRVLHHTTYAKEKERRMVDEQRAGNGPLRSLPYRIMRALWRGFVPNAIKRALGGIVAESKYARRLNAAIGEDFFAGRLTLMDRYVYDRWLKMRLLPRPGFQHLALRILCRVMRPPCVTLALADDATKVFERKQELSPAQIADYTTALAALCRQVGAPYYHLAIVGREPEAVAAEAVGVLLQYSGSELFDAIGRFEMQGA